MRSASSVNTILSISGHLYQMEESRPLVDDAAVVCVMSGDFVQRGEAALIDKFARAEAACRSGADLVVELPLPWCLSSAEGFAAARCPSLAALGCTPEFWSEGRGWGEKLSVSSPFNGRRLMHKSGKT